MYRNSSLIRDWDTLRLVRTIDRTGGVAAAARAMGVTHATISRRLAKAEQEAGILFYERLPAGLKLTAAGQKVLEHAERIEPELDELERFLASHEAGLEGPLRITIPPLMMTDAVSALINRFATDHPSIRLEFVGDNNLLNLHQREADIAIRVTHKPPETLWGRKLTDQSSGFYAQTEWLHNSPLKRGDFSGDLPLISFTSWPNEVPKLLDELCPNIRIVARCDDMVTAMQLVRSGLGVTRMPRILGEALDGVSRIDALPWENYLPLWILTHPDLRKSPKVEAFMKHMADGIFGMRADYKKPET